MSFSDCHRLIVIVWLSDHHCLIMFAQIAKWFPLMWHRRLCSRRIDESGEQERGLCSLCRCGGLCNTSPCCVDYRLELCGSNVWFYVWFGWALELCWELIVPWVALCDAVCHSFALCSTVWFCVWFGGALELWWELCLSPPPAHPASTQHHTLNRTLGRCGTTDWKFMLKYREFKNKYKIALPISTLSSVHTAWNEKSKFKRYQYNRWKNADIAFNLRFGTLVCRFHLWWCCFCCQTH